MPDDDGFPCEGDADYCPKSPAPASDPWHSAVWFVGGPCSWCGDAGDATVDEMIEWLRAEVRNGYRFMDVSAWRSLTSEPDNACSVSMVLDERYDVPFHGATLLEALKKAVAAVSLPVEEQQ